MGRPRKSDVEDQIPLIDVEPENAKKIRRAAREYQKVREDRAALKSKETDRRTKLIELVKASGAVLVDGEFVLKFDSMEITITPSAEKVRVREASDDASDEDDADGNDE